MARGILSLPEASDAMNISRIKTRHLHCLVVVAQERSLVAAARLLALTQPAVSKTIAELEAMVGRPLLERHARGVELTAAGHVLAQHAGASLRTLREGLDAAVGQPQSHQSSVSLGALPNVSATFLPAAVEALRAAVPSLYVRVASGTNAQLMGRLRQGELDLVFGRLAEPSDMLDLEFEQLYAERLVAVARPGHPLADRPVVPPAALAGYTMVLPSAGTPIRRTVDAFLVTHRVDLPPCVIDTLDASFALQFVRRTDAVWFLPEGLVEGFRPIALALLALDTRETTGPVGITTRRGQPLPEGVAKLVGVLREAAATRDGPRA